MKRWRNRHPHENWRESHQGDWVRYEDAQAEIERLQVELDIERKLHQRASEDHASGVAAFKNFHRLLCERFSYGHDDVHWQRDQVSLLEWIAKRTPNAADECHHEDCHAAWRCTKCGEFRGECPPMRPRTTGTKKDPRPSFALPDLVHPIRRPTLRLPQKQRGS